MVHRGKEASIEFQFLIGSLITSYLNYYETFVN